MTTANRAILVVEDELLLRLMAVEIVEDAGFEALAAATADEALSILELRADDVRLVFTDV
jgi:CheY-like chemotaxis protein